MGHEREWTVNEPDEPNTVAVYIIIVLSLVGLVVSMWGLSEYQGHMDKKRQTRIENIRSEVAKKKSAAHAVDMKAVEEVLKEKTSAK
jgi:hypothetical protein